MSVYIRAKFEVSSIILTDFRQGIFTPPPPNRTPLTHPSKQTPKKPTQIRVKIKLKTTSGGVHFHYNFRKKPYNFLKKELQHSFLKNSYTPASIYSYT